MSFPGFAGKHDEDALVTANDWVAWHRRRGDLDGFACPSSVLIVYQPVLFEALTATDDVGAAGGRILSGLRVLGRTEGRVGVLGGFGYGAPIAAQMLENLIAVGARVFVSIGAAGSLQPELDIGDLVVCDGAIRDEGVSHHYLPTGVPVKPDPGLTRALASSLSDQAAVRTGATWTVDAPYRETAAEVRHYQASGVLTVEMEAAALFAVAAVRGVPIASAFCISDLLTGLSWDPRFDATELRDGLTLLAQTSIAILDAATRGLHPTVAGAHGP